MGLKSCLNSVEIGKDVVTNPMQFASSFLIVTIHFPKGIYSKCPLKFKMYIPLYWHRPWPRVIGGQNIIDNSIKNLWTFKIKQLNKQWGKQPPHRELD